MDVRYILCVLCVYKLCACLCVRALIFLKAPEGPPLWDIVDVRALGPREGSRCHGAPGKNKTHPESGF